tara:strand:+ start:692 stop:2233 length:1542 start_codon:yes stop_codon:yes gene_type:complete
MRLLRLTTRKETADFEASYADHIPIKPNSKIALQSVSINSQNIAVDVTTENNEITYKIIGAEGDTGVDKYEKTIQLTPRSYRTTDIDGLLTDITTKFNESSTFTHTVTNPKVLGIEWLAQINDQNLADIGYRIARSKINQSSFEMNKTEFKNQSATERYIQPIANITDNTLTTNAMCDTPISKGNGFWRVKTRKLNTNSGTYTKAGYILGVYTNGDLGQNEVTLADIKAGVYVNVTGTSDVGGDRVATYQLIKDGALVTGTTSSDTYSPTNFLGENEVQEIAINGNQLEVNIYRKNSKIPVSLYTNAVGVDAIEYKEEDLFPIIVFHGGKSGTQVVQPRTTLSPYSQGVTLLEEAINLDALPPSPPSENVNDENVLFFHGASLAQYLGFNNQRQPITGSILGGIAVNYTADREFLIAQEADAMLVQLMNLQVESYDSFSTTPIEGNGQRANILSVIPSKNEAGKIVYEPPYPTFIDLNNKDPINLRNLHIRVVREDYSTIIIEGLATIVVLIE